MTEEDKIPSRGRDIAVSVQPEESFDKDFKQMLDNFFGGEHPRFCPAERVWNPPTDVFETMEAIHVKMELSGVRDEDVEVKVSDNILIIRGKRRDEQNVKRDNFHLMEIQYGSFERVFGLPLNMEVRNVTASLKNGFLLVTVPKDASLREYRIKIE